MYRPPAFREDRIEILHQVIRDHPLATLVTAGASGLIANVLPFTLAATADGDVLQAHLARANDQLGDLRAGAPVLIVFQGPQAYVTPSWYPSKAADGKVVPTWDYVIVQVRGTPRVIDDPQWLYEQVDVLTRSQEADRQEPWAVTDAPAPFISAAIRGIAGLEIPIARIEGKWKVSQNRPERDRIGVSDGLAADGHQALADMVRGGGARPRA